MRVVSSRLVVNPFEARILEVLGAASAPDGMVTNNVVIPHVNFRNLPNEHDLLAFTQGKIYTIDGKALEGGAYRGLGSGGWEYSCDGQSWKPVTFMTHPEEVAFKKARVTESYLRQRLTLGTRIPMPQVISVIVVPDEANVSGLSWGMSGTSTGARLLLTNLRYLPKCLDADHRAHSQRRPTVDELAALFEVERPNAAPVLPCHLSPHLRIDMALGRAARPVERECYRGFDEQLRKPVRVEVLPKYGGGESVIRRLRAFRSNLLVLQELQHDALLRLYAHYDTPMALIVVSEFFSDTSLENIIDERRLTWSEVRHLFAPVVNLLRKAHAHKEQIVHRQLDPSCILMQPGHSGQVRVQGFFGAVFGGYSTIGDVSGEESSPYFAPERSDDELRRSELQDAYSIGRCICAALSGEPLQIPPVELVNPDILATLECLTAYAPEQRRIAWDRLPGLLGC